MVERLETRTLLSAGDVVVGVNNPDNPNIIDLNVYTQDGQSIGAPLVLPPGGGDDLARDFVIDNSSNIEIYNGTSSPHLTVLSPTGAGSYTLAGWSTAATAYAGGIATTGRYVFVTDDKTGADTTEFGLIRFDTANDYAAQRFAIDAEFSDVTLGLDGNLYAVADAPGAPEIRVYNPNTLALVKTVTAPSVDVVSVAADADGNIFAGENGAHVYRLDPAGNVVGTANFGATDLDLSTDGKLLTTNAGPTSGEATVSVLDQDLNVLSQFTVATTQGAVFASWADYQAPAGFDATPPTAKTELDGLTPGSPTYDVTVTYTDDTGIDSSSIDGNDLTLTGASINEPATLKSVTSLSATSAKAIYSFPVPPYGQTYVIALQSNQVRDTAGNPAVGRELGTLKSTRPSQSPTPTPTPSPTPSPTPPPTPTPATPLGPPPAGPLAAAVIASLPSALVAGASVKGKVTVRVTNQSNQPISGFSTIALYASTDLLLDTPDLLITSATKRLSLKAGKSKAIKLPVRNFPATADGAYHLLARVTGPDGTGGVALAAGQIVVASPFVDMSAVSVQLRNQALAIGGKLAANLLVSNLGNIPASGTASIAVDAIPTSGGAAVHVADGSVGVKRKVGASKQVRLKFMIPADLSAGSYHLFVSLDTSSLGDTNTANNMATSAGAFVVT